MKIGHVIVPAAGLDPQIDFYEALGLTTRFRDGDRYAALTDGVVTLGLADASEQPVPGRVLVSIEVDDLDATLARCVALGAEADEPVLGSHERRALIEDPSGNPVVVYEKLP